MSFEKETGRDIYFKQLERELEELVDPNTGLLSTKFSKLVSCSLCNESEYEKLFVKRGYTYVRCCGCGFVYANPQVLPYIVENAYRADHSSTELWMKVLLNEKEFEWREKYFKNILSEIESFVKKGNILDIGCAVGHFLKFAKDSGWETVGLELSEIGAKYAIEKLGLNVLRKTLKDSGFNHNSFDAITMLGVLEHVVDPFEMLKEAVEVVKPGGGIVVVVPNLYCLLNMTLREKSVTFDGRNHLNFFSMDTLKICFEKAGLEVILEDTLLAGLNNMVKYFQFMDPYGDDKRTNFLPESIRSLVTTDERNKKLERFILDNGLGLRLRMIGRKR